MINIFGIVAILATSAFVILPAHASNQNDRNACKKAQGDAAIEGCTHTIEDRDTSIRRRAIAFRHRGFAYQRKGDLDNAIADFSQVIKLKPKFASSYFNRGNAYADKDDSDRAIADYSEAIKIKPNFNDAYFHRGITYRRKGDRDRAIADLKKADELGHVAAGKELREFDETK